MSLAVIIPTYNEKENINRIIDELTLHVPHAQILVVDDNSPDGTADIVRELQKNKQHIHLLVRQKKEGLGKAYIHAFRHAIETLSPSRIVMMDADLSHQPRYVKSMEENFSPGKVIVGSRYIKGGDTIGWETWRKFLSSYGNLYSRIVTGIPINDLTAGFYMIDADLLRRVNFDSFNSSGYAFQIELKHALKQLGGVFHELPIVFVNRVGGESKISSHIISEGLIAPWKIRFSSTGDSVSTRCPLCQNSVKQWGEKNGYVLYQCNKCKLIFVDPLPDPSSVYTADYFSGAKDGFGYVDYDHDKEPMRGVFEKYLSLCALYGKKSGYIYDVGAATGFFLDIAREKGYRVSGVEVSSYAADIARKKGIDVKTGDLLDQEIEKESIDIVSMLDVLEHMMYPFAELLYARDILVSNGLLLINTPNGQSFLARTLKTLWHLVVPPEHISYFSPQNLKNYLETHGFTVVYSGTISKKFTVSYIFKTLYKWQRFVLWDWCARFSEKYMSQLYIPLNLFDNFFI